MLDKIDIQKASSNDISMISFLENEYGYEVYSDTEICNQINNPLYCLLVARKNNEIIGYVSSTLIFEECNILKIIVGKKYKRNGVATALFNELLKVCQKNNIKHIYLEVRQNNFDAISFYEKFGFKLESVRKNYYAQNVDAIIYGLNL